MTRHSFPYPPDDSSGNWTVSLPGEASIGEVILYATPFGGDVPAGGQAWDSTTTPNGTRTGTSTQTVAIPGGTVAGEILVVVVSCADGPPFGTTAHDALTPDGTGWTEIGTQLAAGATNLLLKGRVFWKVHDGIATTVSITTPSTTDGLHMIWLNVFSGVSNVRLAAIATRDSGDAGTTLVLPPFAGPGTGFFTVQTVARTGSAHLPGTPTGDPTFLTFVRFANNDSGGAGAGAHTWRIDYGTDATSGDNVTCEISDSTEALAWALWYDE